MGVVALVVFGLLRLTPGDPAAVIAGDYASPDDVAKIRAKLGLDRPLHVQLSLWFGNLLRGDLGTSIFSGLPVTTLIKQRVEPTVALATLTMIVAITIAVPLGVLAAWKQGSWIDRTVMVFAVSGFSMPVFWLGFLLVWVFAVQLGWLPVQGYSPLSHGLWPFLRQLILPALTLGFVYVALITRMTRVSMLYILPALVAPLIVQGTHICASAILVESYLSFLGAGTPPHIPSWGNVMAEGRAYVQLGVWIILFPGLFLMLTVLSINLIGDGLRDLLKV